MTSRGRATIAAAVVGMAAFLGWLTGPPPWLVASAAVERPALPEVSAPPPAPTLPRVLLERFPVTKEDLLRVEADGTRLAEWVSYPLPSLPGPLRIEYTLDSELTRQVFKVLRQARVALGHVILLDPETGRVLAYASTDVERFPPTRTYPAASLVKVITAATALDRNPSTARLPCRYSGNPYKLTPSRIDPPRRGEEISLRRALATSNNQCFAQLAVHAVGKRPLLDAIRRFGWLAAPAPAHAAGSVEVGEDRFDLGRLGSGLAGSRITPLHAAQTAATLARGELVAPRWIDRVIDADGRELPLPALETPRRVMRPELSDELRAMLVETTTRGTARRAFRKRNGRPLLGTVQVAGKTGSLTGTEPDGRYEWFIGAAPADRPRVAVASLLVQGDLYWRNASQVAADVLSRVFCEDGKCSAEAADRWLRARGAHPVRGVAGTEPRLAGVARSSR